MTKADDYFLQLLQARGQAGQGSQTARKLEERILEFLDRVRETVDFTEVEAEETTDAGVAVLEGEDA